MDKDVRWIVTNAPRETAERYAYGQTHVVMDFPGEGYGPVTVLIVANNFGDVQFSADYQAERLRSGMYVAVVAVTYADAHAVLVRANSEGDWSPIAA